MMPQAMTITIPPEALEAAKDAWYAHQHMGTDDRMTATCLAMLKAWPSAKMQHHTVPPASAIILPLHPEKEPSE